MSSVPVEATAVLEALLESLTDIREERDRYRDALVEIANQESGIWGTIADRALRSERASGNPSINPGAANPPAPAAAVEQASGSPQSRPASPAPAERLAPIITETRAITVRGHEWRVNEFDSGNVMLVANPPGMQFLAHFTSKEWAEFQRLVAP